MKNKVMKKVLMVMLSATMLIGSASVTALHRQMKMQSRPKRQNRL